MNELFGLRGKTAVVTGGSRGIGLHIARGLVAAGVDVTISARKADVVAAAAAELGCRGVAADLSTPEGCRALADSVTGPLHILVNNAGATGAAPLEDFPDAEWDEIMRINLGGVFRLTRDLLPRLREAAAPGDPARVVNIGSVDGFRPKDRENYAYTASKAGVNMLTRHLAKRLAPEHITVNGIAPGPFPTPMSAWVFDDPEMRARVERSVPLGRAGTPEDLVGATTFLCSRAGAYVTGHVLPLDGGIVGCL
ncbi:SDR family oxidoreductase [Streptomyces cylindrosporus]|uniref:SDR family oxidoreductase n=1 Tax=Streptomyces cylindrosporus TaxID=2927583 RepID=A0ABS9Y8A6_9ACTN|nr:SDR family oxidoreductase [Streptomyces cylindrosporus]MCI3273452.1 SDR family oxidoreductase [Streptomyces cylindrosporus]